MSAILVVDDDPQVLEVVGEMLKLAGYEVATAADGREAVAKFRAATFDLVITDLIMPEKEGLETIAEMKSLRGDVPVIAMSGGGRVGPTDYLETARYIGAAATLAKPFTRSELISLVGTLLSEAES